METPKRKRHVTDDQLVRMECTRLGFSRAQMAASRKKARLVAKAIYALGHQDVHVYTFPFPTAASPDGKRWGIRMRRAANSAQALDYLLRARWVSLATD